MNPKVNVDLHLEYLKLKSASYDHVSGLPLINIFYKDLVKLLDRKFPVACFMITILNGEEVEKILTFEHFDRLLSEISYQIKAIVKKIWNGEYILTSASLGGETLFLFFFDTKGELKLDSNFLQNAKKILNDELSKRINTFVTKEKWSAPPPAIFIVERLLEGIPTLRNERQIAREIDRMRLEAKRMLEVTDYDKKISLLKMIENKSINIVFQPIVNAREKQVFGYEALARGSGNMEFSDPESFLSLAQKYNLLKEAESVCVLNALEAYFKALKRNAKMLNKKLFINLSPPSFPVLMSDEFLKALEIYQIPPESIVIELTEKFSSPIPQENEAYFDIIKRIVKQLGFRVAVDDVGTGYSTLERVAALSPHYIKYDRVLFKNVHKDPVKQELLRTIFEFSQKINSKLIVEGVDNNEDYEFALKLGVDLMQGFLFGRPLKFG